ncbi:phosphorylase [Novosphingobium humi]|uniref:phosphorylase family protein n=1 Tax=Novosphingobium humi TaxID=2282397 RepID=UPI0025B04536|nr:phosphorylase [Novosphingobium humi]WJS99373.1 phosphorylase [Novosphingobium humi]
MGNVNGKPVIVVTGTLREAAVLDQHQVEVIAGGNDPERLREELMERAKNAGALLSYGMCGAVDHTLKLGTMVIGKRLTGAFHAKCDERWVAALQALLPQARVGTVHADGHLLTDSHDKAERAWASAAIAADMESHIVAEVAAHMNLPFGILRCISDIAEVELPPAVNVMMGPNGELALGAVMKSIRQQPGQLGSLTKTIMGFAKAYRSLIKGSKQAGPYLGFDLR